MILEILAQKDLCLDPLTLKKNQYNSGNGGLSGDDGIPTCFHIDASDTGILDRLNANIPLICDYSHRLLDIMTSKKFIELLPFGVRYICRHLSAMLAEYFPTEYSDHLNTRVLANVVFFRYIRTCIVFPEAFLNRKDGDKLPSLQARLNLGYVCKLIQVAATGRRQYDFTGIGRSCVANVDLLDSFLNTAFGKLSSMVSEVCSVEEISDYFALNEYSDEALLRPPEIVLTAQEIVDAHELLLSHRTEIAECSANAYHPLDIEFNQLLDGTGGCTYCIGVG